MIEIGKPRFFIDTNILVYALDSSEQEKYPIARQLLEKAWKREASYVTSCQVLAEFFFVVTRKIPRPLQIEQAQQIIEDISSFSSWTVLSYDKQILMSALALYQKRKQHFWDMVLLATMLENGVTSLYTENEKDFDYNGIIVVNPFKK